MPAHTLALNPPASTGMTHVLAVVVVYQRELTAVEPWPALVEALVRDAVVEGRLALRRVLVYDNSPQSRLSPTAMPPGARLVHDTGNGGTVAAFAEAVRQARAEGMGWLLMLDHDTHLPADLLSKADTALGLATPDCIGAVLPRIRHDDLLISPARLTWSGSVLPLGAHEPAREGDHLTAIASGALVRVDALQLLPSVPTVLWLDYFDHWLFLHLRQAGQQLLISEALLAHDLSVADVASMSPRRMQNMLDGEAEFSRALPWPARAVRPFRLLLRALRFGRIERSHFFTVLRALRPAAARRLP